MDSDSDNEYLDQERPIVSETKEGQVQDVVNKDQEELGLVLNAGVVHETLIEDTSSLHRETTLSLRIVDQVQNPIQKLIYWDRLLKRMKKKKTITTM